jgi:hypothetical protein
MAIYRFPKPHPLSPNRSYVDEDGVLYRVYKDRKTKLKGVRYYDSIYYWWYQYLRCSERYDSACQRNGKGMQRIYDDFGDIFAYEDTSRGFWQWWNEDVIGEDCVRGEYLFGIRSTSQAEMQAFVGTDDLAELEHDVANGTVKLIAVPTHLSKQVITRRFHKLVADLKVTPKKAEEAKYHPKQSKVDAVSLDKALAVWKMKFQQGMKHAEIAYELEKNPRFAIRETKHARDAAEGYLYDPRNTVIVRLWKKAQKNIEAVERGEFPLGH